MKQRMTAEEWGSFERQEKKAADKLKNYYSDYQKKYMQENHPNQFICMVWDPIFVWFTIGQMIEFLHENDRFYCIETLSNNKFNINDDHTREYDEPCDALWEVVKEVLK